MQTLNSTSQSKIKEIESLFVQGEYKKSLEQVTNLKKNQKLDKTSTYDLLVLEARILDETDKRDESLKIAETAINLSKSMEDSEKELHAMLLKAACLTNLESVMDRDKELLEADNLINEIETLFDSLSDLKEETSKRIKVLVNLNKGVIYFFKGEFQKAEKHYMESYEELKRSSNIADRIEILRRLSFLHQWACNFDKALEFSEKWFQLTKQTNNKEHLLKIYGIQSICYSEKGNHEKAIKILLEAREILQFLDNEQLKASYLGYLSYAYLINGDLNLCLKFGLEAVESSDNASAHFKSYWFRIILGNCCLHMGELDEALKHANDALEIKIAGAWKMAEAQIFTLIGDIYQLKGEYDEAIDSYNHSLLLYMEEEILYYAVRTHFTILRVYNDLNKIEEASHHLEEIRKISSETDNDIIKQMSLMSEALINKGLADDEWIVRDAAVESLGKIFQYVENKEIVIEKLVDLLDDNKSWVRRSSMNLLSSIKGISASLIPFKKVTENLSDGDSKVREGAANLLKIYSLDNIDQIFNNILSLLGDESEDVRSTTIDVMVEIIQNVGISKMLSKLLKNLSDESTIETQQSIAIILGRSVRYENEKIKKRVISLLKMRCEMSQDPTICEVLTKLRES